MPVCKTEGHMGGGHITALPFNTNRYSRNGGMSAVIVSVVSSLNSNVLSAEGATALRCSIRGS